MFSSFHAVHRQRVDRQPQRRGGVGPGLMITAAESGARSGDHTHITREDVNDNSKRGIAFSYFHM
jgi:hypothetical protein